MILLLVTCNNDYLGGIVVKKRSFLVAMAVLSLSLVACGKTKFADMSDKDLYKTYMDMSESEREDFRNNLSDEEVYRLDSVVVTTKLAEELDVSPRKVVDMVVSGEISLGQNTDVASAVTADVAGEATDVMDTTDVSEDVVEDVEVVEEVAEASGVYEPLQEILDAEIYENIYQVDDLLIHYNREMTIEDVVNQFTDEYTIYKSNKEEINLDRLMPANESEWYSIAKNDTVIFSVLATNYDSEDTIELKDCRAYRFYMNQYCSRNDDLYIYLAKGMRYNEKVLYSDDNLTYENIEAYLQSLGYEQSDVSPQDVKHQDVERGSFYYKNPDGLTYQIYGYDVDNNYTEHDWGRTCNDMLMVTFNIDQDTRYLSQCWTFNTISYIK